ncbi:hypothetical protein MXB_718 [Myxobolus squamalis]|nr:hypothetical protein MXB_718 [Myxobolus squamalis]
MVMAPATLIPLHEFLCRLLAVTYFVIGNHFHTRCSSQKFVVWSILLFSTGRIRKQTTNQENIQPKYDSFNRQYWTPETDFFHNSSDDSFKFGFQPPYSPELSPIE